MLASYCKRNFLNMLLLIRMRYKPVQIIGTQRSGSNLLRLMLQQHPLICAPHPPHILKHFFPLLKHYGDLALPGNLENLLADVLKLIALNPVSWHLDAEDYQRIRNTIEQPTLAAIFKSIYQQKAAKEGAAYWVCKSMSNVHVADVLEAEAINPQYIYLYRDGRDVAASFKRVVVGEKHAYHLARQWKKDQEACLHLKTRIEEARFLAVRYESLIADPEQAMNRIFRYLNVEYSPEFATFYQSEASREAANAGHMWANLIRPCLPANHHKFLTELSAEEISLFEHLAGDVLQTLGYPLTAETANHRPITPADLERFHAENQQLKNTIRYSLNYQDYEKMIPQQRWIKEITHQPTLT